MVWDHVLQGREPPPHHGGVLGASGRWEMNFGHLQDLGNVSVCRFKSQPYLAPSSGIFICPPNDGYAARWR